MTRPLTRCCVSSASTGRYWTRLSRSAAALPGRAERRGCRGPFEAPDVHSAPLLRRRGVPELRARRHCDGRVLPVLHLRHDDVAVALAVLVELDEAVEAFHL